ncbi:HTH-type transcriptional regulator MalT [Vibrio kasasachensis]|uniref:HTH-type transcriptional regulator MalT n=1 Tax=Vibrio kasasachensis TaxID=2910248 RepID=UPI003D0D92F3
MWIPSKLSRPTYSLDQIQRSRITDLLKQTDQQKLVLFRAPAGYGKTTIAAQWLEGKQNIGWYNIDANDNEPTQFASYFLAALNDATGNACQDALKQAKDQPLSSVMSLLIEALKQIRQTSKHAYLVLDDYHHIQDALIHEAMNYFLKHQPDHLTIVLTTRSIPPLGIANLRVRGMMTEVDQRWLAFDIDETTAFFMQRLDQPLDSEEIDRLYQYVEGWPSALELIAWQTQYQAMAVKPPLSTTPLNQNHLWDYLIDEVFAILDNDTQEFLLQCSILDKFNHTLAASVTQRDDAQNMIESLQRYGLFISPVTEVHNWFRFHSLFSEFLHHERKIRLPEQDTHLHQLAARAWLTLPNVVQALLHAKQANDHMLTAEILCQYGWELFNGGEYVCLDNALNSVPHSQIYQQPTLSLLQAWLAQSQHRDEEVNSILAQIDQSEQPVKMQGEFNALKAQIAISKHQPHQALNLAELALSQIDGKAYYSRIVATSVIGEVNHVLGYLDRALPLMQQTEKLARQYQVHHHALWALLQQSEILTAKGHLQASFDVQEIAFKLLDAQQLKQPSLHEFLFRVRAQLLFSWNRLDEAESCVNQALQLSKNQSEKRLLQCYAMLTRLAICRGEMDRAAKFVAEIECRLAQSSYHIDWNANASLSQLLFWQAKQDMSSIQLWLNNAIRPEQACNHFTQMQWRNITRAQIYLGQYPQAAQSLSHLQDEAARNQLVTDISRNAIIESVLAIHTQPKLTTKNAIKEALNLANQTAILGDFLYDLDQLVPLLQQAEFQSELDDLTRFRTNQLLKSITTKPRSGSSHFGESFINQVVNHPKVPELVRNSPLTQREWQVLDLIYSGLSNEQIAHELDVAGTTIKTHIRNLYQKLNIANRKQAISTAESLINLIGYQSNS